MLPAQSLSGPTVYWLSVKVSSCRIKIKANFPVEGNTHVYANRKIWNYQWGKVFMH